jgi:hypothetical protein
MKYSSFIVFLVFAIIIPNSLFAQHNLHLTSPTGGEAYIVGNEYLITWEGVHKSVRVKLEYSTDSGTEWHLIEENAMGLKYLWKDIPKIVSDSCLVRVSCKRREPIIEWDRNYGCEGEENGTELLKTIDSGYVFVAVSQSRCDQIPENNGWMDFWICRLDEEFNIVWSRGLGGTLQDVSTCVQQTADSGFIAVGSTRSNEGDVVGNHGDSDVWVVRLDKNGNLLWTKALGGSRRDFAYYCLETKNGDFIIACVADSDDGDLTTKKEILTVG